MRTAFGMFTFVAVKFIAGSRRQRNASFAVLLRCSFISPIGQGMGGLEKVGFAALGARVFLESVASKTAY